eukprot:TRINITY_DN9600_c0_g3_i1.p1 TRINITY_DN9600_c0_g3~~TRINITY_DN9600_c0_g3_i1.p1  ORF type:complete len:1887 (+),score=453.55 TRINITY_DN9600_c0_g3_i1:247-5907(+)
MEGWLFKRCPAFGADTWLPRWCVLRIQLASDQKQEEHIFCCYADDSCKKQLSTICLGRGARLVWSGSLDLPADLSKYAKQRPFSFVLDAGEGRLASLLLFDATNNHSFISWEAAMHRHWHAKEKQLPAEMMQSKIMPAEWPAVEELEGVDLVKETFDLLNFGSRGDIACNRLGAAEMRIFADLCGFDGDQEEWLEEYNDLCSHYAPSPKAGDAAPITRSQYADLIQDMSDEEKRSILSQLRQRVLRTCGVANAKPVPGLSWARLSRLERTELECQQMARGELVSALFDVLDVNRMHSLESADILRYATVCGFDGDEHAWKNEYLELVKEHKWNVNEGISSQQFATFIGGESWSPKHEVEAVLIELKLPGNTRASAQLLPLERMVWSNQSIVSRRQFTQDAYGNKSALIAGVFSALDFNKQGVIGSDEFRRYAEQIGFEGTDDEWAEEFTEVCEENGWDEDGISLVQFERMITTNKTTVEELKFLLVELRLPARKDTMRMKAFRSDVAKLNREEVLAALFKSLDSGKKGALTASDLMRFASMLGFDGGDEEWQEEFASLCDGQGWHASKGIDEKQFKEFVGDETDMPDADLREALLSLEPQSDDDDAPAMGAQRSSPPSMTWTKSYSVKTLAKIPKMTRKELIDAVFDSLDADSSKGVLGAADFRGFAELCGFTGSDAEWQAEFKELCEDQDWDEKSGCNRISFARFIGAESVTSDAQLRDMLTALVTKRKAKAEGRQSVAGMVWSGYSVSGQRSSRSQLKHSAGSLLESAATDGRFLLALQQIPEVGFADMSRGQLMAALFTELDFDKDAALNCSEAKTYAELSGFNGSEDDWREEFKDICREQGWDEEKGADEQQFAEFLESNTSDQELRELLSSLKSQAPGRKSVAGMSWARHSIISQSQFRDEIAKLRKHELIAAVFVSLDSSKRGRLSCSDLKGYAELSGFEGSDGEWVEEFQDMCKEYGWDEETGIDSAQFAEFLDDSGSSDADLRKMLLSMRLQSKTAAGSRKSIAGMSWSRSSLAQVTPLKLSRQELIDAVFKAVDSGKRGALSSMNFKTYAELSGFDGSDDDWREEFTAVCQAEGWDEDRGVDPQQFAGFVGDKSVTSDEDLREMLGQLMLKGKTVTRNRKSVTVMGKSWSRYSVFRDDADDDHDDDALLQAEIQKMSRQQLIASVFEALDSSARGKLTSSDFKVYAQLSGFTGSEDDWLSEFKDICQDHEWEEVVGVSTSQFAEFLGDESDTSDGELREMLTSLRKRGKTAAGSRKSIAGMSWSRYSVSSRLRAQDEIAKLSRQELIFAVFQEIDTKKTGFLSCNDFKTYAEINGFDGNYDDWLAEFKDICKDEGWSEDKGVDREEFAKFVGNDSNTSDAELRDMLGLLTLRAQTASKRRKSLAGKSWSRSSLSEALPDIRNMSREELVAAVFAALDSSKRGAMSSSDMKGYAELSGFNGSDEDWQQEFYEICQEQGWDEKAGIRIRQFEEFVGDESNTSDAEVRQMLTSLQSQTKTIAGARKSVAGMSWSRQSTSSRLEIEKLSRQELITAVFQAMDSGNRSVLSRKDFKIYAELSGFEGSDDDWLQEFKEICKEEGWDEEKGVEREQFSEFVGDDSNTSDAELRKMLGAMKSQRKAPAGGRKSVVDKPWSRSSTSQSLSQFGVTKMSRQDLVNALFVALDSSRKGALSCSDFKRYGELSGFDGSDDDWKAEFDDMCKDRSWDSEQGVSRLQFAEFVGDASSTSDAELTEMLGSLNPQGKSPKSTSANEASQQQSKSGVAKTGRQGLIDAVFDELDSNKTGNLSSSNFKHYAELSGFDGTDDDWLPEFQDLCKEQGWDSEIGVSIGQFAEFVGDPSNTSDAELKEMLGSLASRHKAAAGSRKSIPGMSWPQYSKPS